MKKHTPAVITHEQLPAPAQLFAEARRLHEVSKLHSSLGCCAMVMAGAEILRLQKELKIDGSGGANSHAGNLLPEGTTWVQLVEQHTGMSKSTVYRYRDMAIAAAKKVKGLAALIDLPAAEITAAQREQIAKAVNKVIDGHTATELFREWGLAKLDPAKEALKARANKGDGPADEPPPESEAEINERTKVELAHDDFAELAANITAYFLKRNQWKLLDDPTLAAAKTLIAAIADRLGMKVTK